MDDVKYNINCWLFKKMEYLCLGCEMFLSFTDLNIKLSYDVRV